MSSSSGRGAPILVTGAAGFIGYHVSEALLASGAKVVGLDNVNDYYSVELKRARIARLRQRAGFEMVEADLVDGARLAELFETHGFRKVVHLAAQAGVRYSLKNPRAYVESNLIGFVNLLERARHAQLEHMVYASSSSVYGANRKMPFSEHDHTDHPLSLYAATKKSNEMLAHSYAHLFRTPLTGLRFFTVYGPWGRPDMAMYLFADAIMRGKPIDIFNNGDMRRDFTFVADVVESIVRLVDHPAAPSPEWNGAAPDPAISPAPYRVYNIGNHSPVELMFVVELIEKALGKKAEKRFLPMQAGDVPETYADVADLGRAVGFKPATPIEEGIARFIEWYRSYHGL